MMFAGNPGVLAAGVGGKTYDEFVAHIEYLAGGQTRGWESADQWNPSIPTFLTEAASAPIGNMRGSSWLSVFRGSDGGFTATCRVVQHGLPSEAVFNEQVANQRKILVTFSTAPSPSGGFLSLDRNGYESDSGGTITSVRKCDEILYWDGTQAQRMQPHLGLGPEPYDWT